jgi:hypothetical protein
MLKQKAFCISQKAFSIEWCSEPWYETLVLEMEFTLIGEAITETAIIHTIASLHEIKSVA